MGIVTPPIDIKFIELIPSDIPILCEDTTLYSLDFRAISENMDYEIPTMFKYENLLSWILQEKAVLVNEFCHKISHKKKNKRLIVPSVADPRISLYQRFLYSPPPIHCHKIFAGIPHPDADELALRLGAAINCSYQNFQNMNDKIRQKKLFAEQTPNWFPIDASEHKQKDFLGKYLKRQYGSGGYSIYSPNEVSQNLYNIKGEHNWYAEDICSGLSCSIQVYKGTHDEYIVFGFSEQIIEGEKHFSGARLKRIELLGPQHRKQLSKIISKCASLLEQYNGFFGIDFIIDTNNEIQALEMNVRMTAVTIPTLLFNEHHAQEMLFLEDADLHSACGTVLTYSLDGTGDILKNCL